MKILSIETSCDETAVAILEGEGNRVKVISSVIASQIDIHKLTGGVVPEVAAREHVIKINATIQEAIQNANLTIQDIDIFAVTRGPGLLSSLIVGYSAAYTLAKVLNKPLVPVHHIAGHIYANWLNLEEDIQFPVMVLTVSGGHNELVLLKDNLNFELIGETLDDAAGEAYDKVARLLGLGYPGGPEISRVAKDGDKNFIEFPRALNKSNNFNFSFSGLKTAVLREIEKFYQENGQLTDQFIKDCAASFQEAINDSLSQKLILAAKKYQVKEIHLAGGVSANQNLREMVTEKIKKYKLEVKFRFNENLSYCTDNAAMIGCAGYYIFKKDSEKYSSNTVNFPLPQLNLYEEKY